MAFGLKKRDPNRPLRPFTRAMLSVVVRAGRRLVPEQGIINPSAHADLPQISAQEQVPIERERTRQMLAEAATKDEPESSTTDVILDIPTVKIDEIKLSVEKLDARVALRAELANLVRIDVGAQVGIDKVDLDIKGVEAQAALKVRLKQVSAILARALDTLDRNPALLESLVHPVGEALGGLGRETIRELGGVTRQALGPEGVAQEAVKGVGETAKGVQALEGPVSEAVKDASQGVGRTVAGEAHESEQERRHYHEEGKRLEHEPEP